MGRTLTALIAAGALVLAACGDDSGDEEEDAEETEETAEESEGEGEEDAAADEEEVVDSGAGEEGAAGGDATEACAAAQSNDLEQMAGVTPPEEISDAWTELTTGDPENLDSDAATEVGNWIVENCTATDAEGDPGAEGGEATDTGTADSGTGADTGGAPGDDGFMDDFCVELPEGVDNDMAC